MGAIISDLMLQALGIGAFLVPVFLASAGRALVPLAQDHVAGGQDLWAASGC